MKTQSNTLRFLPTLGLASMGIAIFGIGCSSENAGQYQEPNAQVTSANSNGSFSAQYSTVQCSAQPAVYNPLTGYWYDPVTGAQIGTDPATGLSTGSTLNGGDPIPGAFTKTTLHMSGSNGNYAVLTPSFITGLFTDTTLSTKDGDVYGAATADVGIQVCVWAVDPSGNIHYPQNVAAPGCVTYDRRIQQISNTLFQGINTCVTTIGCTSNSQCTAGTNGTCIIYPGAAVGVCGAAPLGQCGGSYGTCPANSACTNVDPITGVGTCTSVAPGCSFSLLTTSLEAHNYQFIFPINQTGSWTFPVSWRYTSNSTSTPTTTPCTSSSQCGANNSCINGHCSVLSTSSAVAACVGPGLVTGVQVKNFQNNGDVTSAY